MSAVKIHGILLVVVLLIAFQTWTRDRTGAREPDGTAMVWEGNLEEITFITYDKPTSLLRVERRRETGDTGRAGEAYLWGSTVMKPSSDSAAMGAAPERNEYPVGVEGEDLLQRLASLRALRDLGELDDEAKAEYGLSEPERTLTVGFADGERELEFGETVFGAAHRYALDPVTGRGYVISIDVVRPLEAGRATLQARKLHQYDASDVARISVRTPTGQRRMLREGNGSAATWTSPDTPGQPDQTFANFVERLDQLGIAGYDAKLNVDTVEFVVRIEYTGRRERPLGFLELFRGPPDDEGNAEYYLRTETTRIPARTYRGVVERVAQDLTDIF